MSSIAWSWALAITGTLASLAGVVFSWMAWVQAGRAKDAALAFYSGARADLNGFKDEYRNAVSHVRVVYDEHQALRALTQVQTFMERLAEKLDDTHKRINWRRS